MKLTKINIKERMEYHNVIGLGYTVIYNAKITVAEQYGFLEAGTTKIVNANSIFSACSISKFLTGMLVMLLTEQGLFDLDEDINKKLKSWKVPGNKYTKNKKVTLRNLLCHQSGIIDPEGSFMELNINDGIPSMTDLLEGKTPYCNVPIQVSYEPESDFRYSDAGYCIVQLIIEDVTGKPFEKIIDEQIFQPLKMCDSSFPVTISEGNSYNYSCGHIKSGKLVDGKYTMYPYPAASGLWTTPKDLSTLLIELINTLNGKSKAGLSVSTVKEMISSQGCKEWTGLGIFLDESKGMLEVSSLGWGMGFQCMLVAYPYLETGLVIMTNTDLGVHQLKGIIGEVFDSYASGL
jgi:CubicO group peptidase (beta-lactamase class C family)